MVNVAFTNSVRLTCSGMGLADKDLEIAPIEMRETVNKADTAEAESLRPFAWASSPLEDRPRGG